MERILIKLDENPSLPHVTMGRKADSVLQSIIQKAIEAKNSRASRSKKADDRILQNAIAVLLESPKGISRADLLAISESDNLISITARLRNHFRANNIYTLVKNGSGDSTVYSIESV